MTVSGNLTRTGGNTIVAGNAASPNSTTAASEPATHQSLKVEGGTLLFPPLPQLEEKGEKELPVLEVKPDVDASLTDPLVKDADRLLIVNAPSLASD